jgi:hypothetical protein
MNLEADQDEEQDETPEVIWDDDTPEERDLHEDSYQYDWEP